MKYVMTNMQHRHLFVNSLLPHLKYPLRQHKFQTQVEALQASLQLEENQYQKTYPTIKELKEDLKNLTFQFQNKSKEKTEVFGVPHVGQKDTTRTNAQHSRSTWKQDCQILLHQEDYGVIFVRHRGMIHITFQ
jgi:ribosomal protein L9